MQFLQSSASFDEKVDSIGFFQTENDFKATKVNFIDFCEKDLKLAVQLKISIVFMNNRKKF